MKLLFKKNGSSDTSLPSPSKEPRDRQFGMIENISKPQVYSYHTRRVLRPDNERSVIQEDSDYLSSISRARRWFMLIGLLILLGAVIDGLRVGNQPQIVIIQPAGYNYMPHNLNQYRAATVKAIDSSFLNRFKLTLSSSNIATKLEEEFPEIAHAAVDLKLIGTEPTVYIQLVKPALIYVSAVGKSYLVNGDGIVIGSTSILPPSKVNQLPRVNSINSLAIKDGTQVLTSSNVTFIQIVQQALSAKGIVITKMELVPMAEELDVYPGGVGYYVKFNLHETDALQQIGTYLATVATLKNKNITPSQYINVMVDGRAYYK
ncbi:hypothetical protein M1512_01475 [Patescibacteria group bacterium]|jgi:hypothetical protein|nr:hypothetical protein [Patescibacteria group bacterium]